MSDPHTLVSALEYAKGQGITKDAVVKRIKRGALEGRKVDGAWHICVPITATDADSEIVGTDNTDRVGTDGYGLDTDSETQMPIDGGFVGGDISDVGTDPNAFSAEQGEGVRTDDHDFGTDQDSVGAGETEPLIRGTDLREGFGTDNGDVGTDTPANSPESDDIPLGAAALRTDSETVGTDPQIPVEGTELRILRVKMDGMQEQNELLRTGLDAARDEVAFHRGEMIHLREIIDRLSTAVTNEQVLRLNSSPPANALDAHTTATDVPDTDLASDDFVEAPAAPPEGSDASVTIRGAKSRGWLSRLFGLGR